jgi:hypothetical protein
MSVYVLKNHNPMPDIARSLRAVFGRLARVINALVSARAARAGPEMADTSRTKRDQASSRPPPYRKASAQLTTVQIKRIRRP